MKDGRTLSRECYIKPFMCLVHYWWILPNYVPYSFKDSPVNLRPKYEASWRSCWILILTFILPRHEETDTAPFLAPQYDNNPPSPPHTHTPLLNVRKSSLCVTLHVFPDHFQRNINLLFLYPHQPFKSGLYYSVFHFLQNANPFFFPPPHPAA